MVNVIVEQSIIDNIWKALNLPESSGNERLAKEKLNNGIKSGWIDTRDIETILNYYDNRLFSLTSDTIELLNNFSITRQWLHEKPSDSNFDLNEVITNISAITPVGLASFFIDLEDLGFNINTQELCKYLLPEIKQKKIITEHELRILHHSHNIGNKRAIIKTRNKNINPSILPKVGKFANGYKYEIYFYEKDKVYALIVKGPKYKD